MKKRNLRVNGCKTLNETQIFYAVITKVLKNKFLTSFNTEQWINKKYDKLTKNFIMDVATKGTCII